MKLVSFLLAVYIVGLAIRPCCQDSYCSDGDTCQLELVDSHHGEQHQDSEHQGSCSPFYTCGNCVGFTFPMVSFSLTPQTVLLPNLVATYNRTFLSEFHMAIWQPPKIG
ncbi:hypothetical protein EHW67_02010 [Arenibacter aquaticus]|uniref:Uncharacterized protein n=1 Tax=Arenibacter aquaticus TaxID=2489054 RepID=A0A430K8H8_9FLAO|nr:DUF6660 family protein [Arenibacter aquaticus]RTE55368.1 hypothetical protein EHW67_02010 [Arenibacter aquaticus]